MTAKCTKVNDFIRLTNYFYMHQFFSNKMLPLPFGKNSNQQMAFMFIQVYLEFNKCMSDKYSVPHVVCHIICAIKAYNSLTRGMSTLYGSK